MQLPEHFAQYTLELMGQARFDALAQGLEQDPPASIRLNPLKPLAHSLPDGTLPVPWCAEGRYLPTRPNFTADPLLHAGAYYVQEAASMFVTHVLRQYVRTPVRMLDLCAAPGGKSTAARSVLPEGSLLFANEPIRQRANILCENIQKYGHADVVVTNNYPRDYRKARIMFDVILADVPCSGEGMFRKDAGAVADWSPRKVAECAALQRDIVGDAWQCLAPGGLLIYSTCTFNAEEDEKNVAWIAQELGGDVLTIDTQEEWNITGPLWGDAPCCRFLPGTSRGEGLFMAAVRKHGDAPAADRKERKRKRDATAKRTPTPKGFTLPLRESGLFELLADNGRLMAIRKPFADVARTALQSLNVMQAGIVVGVEKGKAVVPQQALALAADLDRTAFPTVQVDTPTALSFLHRDAITLPEGTPTGYVLVACQGHPLGFVKNIGPRCNNLYPAEWRIRNAHLIEQ